MHERLLSFLTAIESAVSATPAPAAGVWQMARTINFHRGLARLSLALQKNGEIRPLGTIQVQGYKLADESTCLRAVLGWQSQDQQAVHTICGRPGLDWLRESRRIAAEWCDGAAAVGAVPVARNEEMLASG